MLDSTEDWLPRANSLSSIDSYTEAAGVFEPRVETRRLVIREVEEETEVHEDVTMGDGGAARLRDLPVRKAYTRRAAPASTKTGAKRGQKQSETDPSATSSTNVIRSRRKLRDPTPDVDVEGD
ncbi:uncharacterized protein LOC123257265 [Drosophila ananassae]|uniref:uncharacterized protein LOC123257265 n=1 Tax=Drosophila ananassae TaxID=7217 RepID=UPI001CFF732C|nr:uncharacterized protein LOC123257265 [Drosophila ananassae]